MNFSASPYIVHFNEATLLQTDSRNASHHAEFPVVAWRTGVESKGPRVDNLSIYNYKHSIEIILYLCVYVYIILYHLHCLAYSAFLHPSTILGPL